MLTIVGVGSAETRSLEFNPANPQWRQGLKSLNQQLWFLRVCISWKLDSEVHLDSNLGTTRWDVDILSGILVTAPNSCPSWAKINVSDKRTFWMSEELGPITGQQLKYFKDVSHVSPSELCAVVLWSLLRLPIISASIPPLTAGGKSQFGGY